MNILLTGATGLVGNEIYNELKHKHNVIANIRNSEDKKKFANYIINDLSIGNKEICDEEKKIDLLIHCAAAIPDLSKACSDEIVASINRVIDDKIIRFCIAKKIKLIYFSSTSVYDFSSNFIIDEKSPLMPELRYSKEKLKTEELIKANVSDYVVFRLNSPYGNAQLNRNVLKIFIELAVSGKALKYYGTGLRTQDFVHVSDVAKAIEKAISYSGNEVFNIASGRSIGMKNLAELIAVSAQRQLGKEIVVMPAGIDDPQENFRINFNIEKARKELKWNPLVSLDEKISEWLLIEAKKNENCRFF